MRVDAADPAPDIPGARFERLLTVPRAVLGVALVILPPAVSHLPRPVMASAGSAFLIVSAISYWRMRRGPVGGRWRVGTSAADTVVCAAVIVALGTSESSPAVLLVPLLGFELALKHGLRGAGLALAGLGLAVAARAVYRAQRFGLDPRPWLIIVMVAAAGLLMAAAGALRVAEHRRLAAEHDRRRLGELLRGTVEAVLVDCGRRPDDAAHRDLRDLVELACHRPEAGSEIARRLAEVVSTRSTGGPLSARETEVLRLVRDGLTDREIAKRLFLSQGTVRVHVSHAVRKLGVDDRIAAVAWLRENDRPAGLAEPAP